MEELSELELQAYAAQDRQRLAVAQNVTTNGRWFCALLVAINIMSGAPLLAVLAAAPIGLACIVDQMRGRAGIAGSLVSYTLAAAVAVASLINAW